MRLMNLPLAINVLIKNNNDRVAIRHAVSFLKFWDVIRPNSSIDFFLFPWYNTIRN